MDNLLERIVCWLVLGGYIALVFVSYVELIVGWAPIWAWVEEHETLTAGLLALGSALVAAILLHRQISTSERHEKDRVRRRRQAVRTVVPLTVLALAEYVESTGILVRSLLDQCENGILSGAAEVDIPTLPSEVISVLHDLAETVEPIEAIFISQIISHLQIQRSTIKSWKERRKASFTVLEVNLQVSLVDAATLLARANALWEYARWQTREMPAGITFRAVLSSLKQLNVHYELYEEVWKIFETRSNWELDRQVPNRWTVET